MQVEPSEPKKAKLDKKKKKVPKFTRIPLDVKRLQSVGMTQKRIDELHAEEMAMQQQERLLKERDMARNSLEAYVYDIRDKLDNDELQAFMAPGFKEEFNKRLEVMEDWLYSEEGFDSPKKVFVEKLAGLTKDGDAVSMRRDEFEKRGSAIESLQNAATAFEDMVKTSAASASSDGNDDGEKKYAHWDDADRKVITDACDTAREWLANSLSKLKAIQKHENPPVTVRDIVEAKRKLDVACFPVVTKPVPKPEPKPEPKSETETKEGDEKGEASASAESKTGGDDPMEEDAPKEEEESEEAGKSAEPMDTSK